MKLKIISVLTVLIFLGVAPNYGCGQSQERVIKIDKKGKQGYLGVEIQDVTKKLKEKQNLSVSRGAYVQSVVKDSPAEEAGIQKGDVIVKFGDESVDDGEELTDAVRAAKPKTEVKVEVDRKGEKKIIAVVVGKLKTPLALAYNFNDDGAHWFSAPPKAPKLSKKFNIRVFTESEVQGLQFQPLTKQLGEYFGAPRGRGVLISEVEKGSDAEKAGFKAGDVITKVDDHSIDDIDELRSEMRDVDGKEIPFEVIRGGKPLKLTMKIDKESEDSEDEEEWSENVIIAPQPGCMKTFRLDGLPHRLELEHLHDRLFDLREEIQEGVRNIKRTIKRELIES